MTKLPEGTPILRMDSPTFAADLANALGIQPGEKIQIVTPQFERTDGIEVALPQFTPENWAELSTLSEAELRSMGLGVWDSDLTGIHFLFPKEWYPIIPAGLMVKFIGGEEEPFIPGETDDDYRHGCLAFGFFKPATVPA